MSYSSLQTMLKRSSQALAVVGSVFALQFALTNPLRAESPYSAQVDPVQDVEPDFRNAVGWGIGAAGIGIVGLSGYASWRSSRSSSSLNRSAKADLAMRSRSRFSESTSINFNQANRKLQRELLRLLHDDAQAANRLVAQVKRHHPERSIDWCIEKVIYDLGRDRH